MKLRHFYLIILILLIRVSFGFALEKSNAKNLPSQSPLNIFKNPTETIENANVHSQKTKKSEPKKMNTYDKINQQSEIATKKIKDTMTQVTGTSDSLLQQRLQKEQIVAKSSFGITFYQPTYVLPFYYTFSPDYAVYKGDTPDNQQLKKAEFKAQLSFKVPLLRNWVTIGNLFLGYTQLSYWQFYASSQYFRETDYEPELFLSKPFLKNWLFTAGIVHQSNGRGGSMERSWNRAYLDIMFSGRFWYVSLKPWILIFKAQSSNAHNPDIAHYLGYGRILLALKFKEMVFSVMGRNMIPSGFARGALETDLSFPIHGYLKGYIQYFNGYGQSLIEYNHRTQAAGIGIALSDWI